MANYPFDYNAAREKARSEYEATEQSPLAADFDTYWANKQVSDNWDDEDCPPENLPDCDA